MMTSFLNRAPLWLRLLLLLAVPHSVFAAMTFETPISGTAKTDWIILDFMDHGDGVEPLDYQGGLHTYATHEGIDFMIRDFYVRDEGVAVLAAAPGVVTRIVDTNPDENVEPGNTITIRHMDGSKTYYAHNKQHSACVVSNQEVVGGQKIAEVSLSATTISHLHFQVYSTNLVPMEIMTNQAGFAHDFTWFDSYSNQVIRQVWMAGITRTNDPQVTNTTYTMDFFNQTARSYSCMTGGPFCIWLRGVGWSTNDTLAVRLQHLSGPGATIDFSSETYPDQYYRIRFLRWYSCWAENGLSNGATYQLQYRWNAEDWRDAPGVNTLTVDNSRYEVYLSRYSPGYTNPPATPAAVAATAGTRTNSICLTWTETDRAIQYQIYRNLTNNSVIATQIVATSNTGYDDTNTVPEAPYYYWVVAVNPRGTSAVSVAASGWRAEPAGEGPEVRINNYRSPPIIGQGTSMVVTVQLQSGIYTGIEADWWVAANTPLGWYYFTAGQWVPLVGELLPAYQGPLQNLSAVTVLDHPGLPPGEYTFYFAVDARDGRLDVNQAWIDSASGSIR